MHWPLPPSRHPEPNHSTATRLNTRSRVESGALLRDEGSPARKKRFFRLQISGISPTGGRGGFTLVELLVYMGITSIALVIFTNFAVTTSQSAARSKIVQELQQNARLTLDRLSQEVRGAQAISSTPQNFTDGVLVLTTSTGTHTFAVNGSGALTLDTGSGAEPLTSSKVEVALTLADTSPSVTITLTLSDTLSNPPQSLTVTTSLIPHQQLY